MTLSPNTLIGLGTGKFDVKFKTGAVGACFHVKLSCQRVEPMFQRFVMSYDEF